MEYLRVRNWDKYQHYKSGKRAEGTPPWIKLYMRLLRDYEFSRLDDSSKWHFVGILLLAAEHDNRIPADPVWIARELGADMPVNIATLVSTGLIARYTNASNGDEGIASREVEVEVEVEVDLNPLVRGGADGPEPEPNLDSRATVEALHRHFNAVRNGRQPLKLTPDRRTKYRARLKSFTPAEIIQAIDNALSDPFYRGENDRNTRFDFPETVLKNDAAVDRHLQRGQKVDPVMLSAARARRALDD